MGNADLKGKKLLLLGGTSTSSYDIIKYAKSKGVYTIVCDNAKISPAKELADEKWLISTMDIKIIVERAKEAKVDGVFAGVSEFNIENALTVSEHLGLPFYATREQWNILSNKSRFKQLCRDNNIPVVEEYFIDDSITDENVSSLPYPAIIKPVDAGAVVGITVCNNETDFKHGLEKALSHSASKKVIVEKYIEGKQEVSIYYMAQNGNFYLTGMTERLVDNRQDNGVGIPVAQVFLSSYLKQYMKQLNERVINMFKSIGVKNGFLFIQAFVDEQGFYFFEMGFRLSGSQPYHVNKAQCGVSQLEMMVDFALTGKMDGHDGSLLNNPFFEKPCCTLSFMLKPGVIGKIEGLKEISAMKEVLNIMQLKKEGDIIEPTGTLHQLLMRMQVIGTNKESFISAIKKINSLIKVQNDKNENMLLNTFDPEVLRKLEE